MSSGGVTNQNSADQPKLLPQWYTYLVLGFKLLSDTCNYGQKRRTEEISLISKVTFCFGQRNLPCGWTECAVPLRRQRISSVNQLRCCPIHFLHTRRRTPWCRPWSTMSPQFHWPPLVNQKVFRCDWKILFWKEILSCKFITSEWKVNLLWLEVKDRGLNHQYCTKQIDNEIALPHISIVTESLLV